FETQIHQFVIELSSLNANGDFNGGTNNNSKTKVNWSAVEISIGVVPESGFALLYHYGLGTTNSKGSFDVNGPTAGSMITITANIEAYSKAQSLSLVYLY